MNSPAKGPWRTHAVDLRTDVVVKRFPAEARDRAERERRALTLLARYAPGLAPEPVATGEPAPDGGGDGADGPVTVVMTRLAGVPLRGTRIGPERVKALAEAVSALHEAVPATIVAGLPPRPGRQSEIIRHIGRWRAARATPAAATATATASDDDAEVARALDTGLAWLDLARIEPRVPHVFGPGDGNLANYLWDGTRVRVVDFEESGRSDRAYELAEITEHVSGWVDTSFDVPAFLGHFTLSSAETARLRDCRRLLALVWLFLLSADDPHHPRNPPGTARRQARRLMELLG